MEIAINVIIIGIPLFLTVMNIYNLFAKKKRMQNTVELLIFILGPISMLFMYRSFWHPLPWLESTTTSWLILNFHEPISNFPTLLLLAVIAIIGYGILRIRKRPLPPLMTVICMSSAYIGCVLSLLFILQLAPHITDAGSFFYFECFLMCLFPLNFIILVIALTRKIMKQTLQSSRNNNYKSKFMIWCSKVLEKSNSYPIAAFVLMWPLLGIIIATLTLFGQKPDSIITAFTETSDWLFSQHVSPAIGPYGYEYLCTAAAHGHESIVKPIRKGVRGGRLIIVNRQLCVANAFEELIQQKTPCFHRLLRKIYDTIGCPIAKRIITPLAADIAYVVIKPLEWLLLIVLYLVEVRPENRIARQYLPTNIKCSE